MGSYISVTDNSYYTGLWNHIRNDSYAVKVYIDGVDCHYESGFGSYTSAYSAGERWLKAHEAEERERIRRNIATFGSEYYFPKPEPLEKRVEREREITRKVEDEVFTEWGCLMAIGGIFAIILFLTLCCPQ